MKVWITRYALTIGIQERDAKKTHASTMVAVDPVEAGFALTEYFHGNDWHKTRGEAILRAEEMRKAKIKSLEKKLSKLRELEFE